MKTELSYLSNADRKIMQSYFSFSDSMAELLGECCEIVIHSLSRFESSIIKIINGFHTGRKVGNPITDKGLQIVKLYQKDQNLAKHCYFTRSPKGDLIKSITHIIIGSEHQAIGLFCININLSYPFDKLIAGLIAQQNPLAQTLENFISTPQDLIETTLNNAIVEVQKTLSPNSKLYKKTIISYLFENGIFELKDAVPLIAEKLQISQQAVYKHLREYKQQ